MMRSSRKLPWTLGILLLMAGVSSTATADVRTEARRAFRSGMQMVQDGDVDGGIARLEEAYDILPHPNVLYNIARAYAEAGRYDEALEYFERYLAADPPDREEVEGFVSALQDRLAATQAPVVETTETVTEVETPGGELGPTASAEEIQALEDAATQIAALAEATQSQALAERAERLRLLASQLREGAEAAEAAANATETTETTETAETAETPPETGLELGGTREDDLYEEQVVSASRFAQSPLDAPNATYNITAQDVRLTGHVHIGELLRRVPGVDVMATSPADVQIGMRGFNQRLSPRVLVLIDGRSIYIDTLGATLLSIVPFNTEDIERIEVIRGPASALYGADAFSGIVNIITREPGEPRTDFGVGFGNAGRVHGHVATSGRAGNLSYRIGGGYNRTDRFTREISDERFESGDHTSVWDDPNLAQELGHLNANLNYRVNEDVSMYVQGAFNDNSQNFQGTGPLRDFLAEGPNVHLMAGIQTSWGSIRTFWNGQAALTGPSAVVRGGDDLTSKFRSNTIDLEAEFAREFELGIPHNLHVGFGYRRKLIDWDFLDNIEEEENHYSLFFQDSMHILDELIAVASFRVDFHPLLDNPVFSPRGAVVLRPTDGQAIRLSAGTAFRTQTFLESYLNLANPTPVSGVSVTAEGSEIAARNGGDKLVPEDILSVEVGYRFAEYDTFDVDVSLYWNRVENISQLSQVAPYALRDYANGRADYEVGGGTFALGTIGFQNTDVDYSVVGGELALRVYPATGLDLYANYSYNNISADSATQTGVLPFEGSTSDHKVNVGVQYRSTFGLDLSVDLHYASSQFWVEQTFDAVRGVVNSEFDQDAYYLLNARIGYRLLDDALELGLVGFNLTDNQHRQHPFAQELRLRVMGTAAVHF